jgi:hypothetical protein
MKNALLVFLLILVPAGLMAAVVEVQVRVSVTLAASPASVTLGSPVTLTATPTVTSSLKPNPLFPWRAVPEHLRYTFTAERTWPCPASVAIATNVATKTVTWNPQAAGIYDFSVKAVYSVPSIPVLKGGDTISIKPAGATATASLANYKVQPQSGFSNYVKTDFNPPTPATAPVNLYLTVSINFPPENRWYRYQYWCSGGCQPATGVKDHQPASTAGSPFQMTLANPGTYTWSIGVDKVRQSDCTWEESVVTHSDPYYYQVKP